MPLVARLGRKSHLCLAGLVSAVSAVLFAALPQVATAQEMPRRFTVADDIGLTHFAPDIADPVRYSADPVTFSPDGRYFVVLSQRGRLDLNRVESSLRVYRTEDVQHFLSDPSITGEPSPTWTLNKSTYKAGPIITNVRWLADSGAVAFLTKTASGNNQLLLADIQAKTVQSLTPADQFVTAYDIRSRSRYAYTVLSAAIRKASLEDEQATAIVGVGRTLDSLVFPKEILNSNVWVNDLSELWVTLDGRRFRVADASSGKAVSIHLEGQRALALSPDGRSVVTALTVKIIPPEWETLYPSPIPTSPYRIRAGRQNPDGFHGQRDLSEYVLIDVSNGKTKPLTHAPIANPADWLGLSRAAWSSDGQSVVLSNAFIPPKTDGLTKQPNPPCVVVADLVTGYLACVKPLRGETPGASEEDRRMVYDVHFTAGNNRIVTVEYLGLDGGADSGTFVRSADGSWSTSATAPGLVSEDPPIDLSLKQGLNDPPVLAAADRKSQKSRIVWDPNPQLKDIQMGSVSVFKWKDSNGRDWVGGLYRPPDYVQGKRYPLVIQNHGFTEREFRPSGSSTTAFAAQELAAVGFLVLQVSDCPIRNTAEEGSCQVAGYEAAVEQLSNDTLVDRDRIGIIGFSRTCYYVLEALTTSTLDFKAASITDGINHGYLQYLLNIDGNNNSVAHEADETIGSSPFGDGLQLWIRRSPEFNMDRVTTPLQVVATRKQVLQMWEPYAVLRYLNKPVDLLVLDSDEHVFTNPIMRLISQGGTVDWFRFWLQDYEDPDPAKSEQYKRWESMRPRRDAAARAGPNGSVAPEPQVQ